MAGKPSQYGRNFGYKQSNFGSNTNGHDVKAYGDTTGKYAMWDASLTRHIVEGDATVSGTHSATGGYTGNLTGAAYKTEARTATTTS